jgi:hypothetical protein
MGRSARREAITKLREQIAVATDPKLIARLSGQLAKLLPKMKAVRTVKAVKTGNGGVDGSESTFKESDYHPVTADFLKKLPMGEREFWRTILTNENERKPEGMRRWAGRDILSFSDAEREALDAYCTG